jgi:hypothetical protein
MCHGGDVRKGGKKRLVLVVSVDTDDPRLRRRG